MNISIMVKNTLLSLNAAVSIELKPAVLGTTDAKKAADTFSKNGICPIVSGLEYSKIKKNTVPSSSKINDIVTTSLVCKLNLTHLRCFARSLRTPNPVPPAIISALKVKIVIGESVYDMKLFPVMSNPALQKAETE
jgi:hypothetical protein